jgi:hypothetical protein
MAAANHGIQSPYRSSPEISFAEALMHVAASSSLITWGVE